MALTTSQRRYARILLSEANRFGASPREVKALIEAGLVESNLSNPNYGDRDSVGILQERSHYGSVGRRMNPHLAAQRFLREARQLQERGFRGSAGNLAQAVQRSAFPERYDQRGGEADAILRGLGGSRVDAPSEGQGGSQGGALRQAVQERLEAPRPQVVTTPLDPPLAPQLHLAFPPTAAGAPDLPQTVIQPPAPPPTAVPAVARRPDSPADGLNRQANGVTPGGGYAGSQGVVESLGEGTGLRIGSTKRDPVANRRVGGSETSDHLTTQRNSYAIDFEGNLRSGGSRVAKRLGISNFRYGQDYTVSRKIGDHWYRIQLLTKPHGTGPHVHVGARRIR